MARIAESLIDLIGNTPLVKLGNYSRQNNIEANILAKPEYFNPLGSVKDRAALGMIEDAEKRGILKEGSVIVEPTSGNTGVGLAFISAIKGYKLILTMPDTMSIERRKLLAALGAHIVLTPGRLGMQGAIDKANEILKENEGSFMPNQFSNPANPAIHKRTTAQEIIRDTDGNIDFFVAGVGSGGTLSGVGEALKEYNPQISIIAVEPDKSAVLSGGLAAAHGIQGIGAGFVPEALNREVIDEVIRIRDDEAIDTAKEVAKTDGLLVGISSGAAICAAKKLSRRKMNKGKNIVVILPDTGERYLSTALFD